MKSNPKTHDALFKWLIAAFTREFFEHYFPDIHIETYRFIDKEFIRKYEALKESLTNDLLKREVKMEMIETTISEHIYNQGKTEGKTEGKIEGKTEGKIEGKIELLENMYLLGTITKEQFDRMAEPLRLELAELEKNSSDKTKSSK